MTEPTVRIEPIHTEPGMGRSLIEHDPASRPYPVRGVLARAGEPRRNKTWRRPTAYDQGSSSSCVGQTTYGMLFTSPQTAQIPLSRRKTTDPYDIYQNAQQRDQWPGEEPSYYGTSALGAMKYLAELGLIKEYRWCFGVDDVVDTIVQHGPVGIGVWWYDGMMDTDSSGFIRPTGNQNGGHEVEIHGVNISGKYVIGTNSWGTSWGVKGRFKLSWEDLGLLLDQDGDAVTIVSC